MTNVLRLAALTVAMSSLLAAPAFAGGGSSKSDPELTVKNDFNEEFYVQVVEEGDEASFQADVIARLTGGQSLTFSDAFTDLGGVVINADGREEFDVDEGDFTILFANAADVDAVVLDPVLNPNAADDIAALFSAATVEVDGDVTVELSEL